MLAALGPRRRPLLGVAGALTVTALTLTGCAAGQQAQSVEQTSVVDGTGFQAGDVKLRDVGLRAPSGASYAAGDNAYLEGFVVNTAADADELTSVSTPAATSVELFSDGVSALLALQSGAGAGATPSASASGTPSDTASGTDSAGTGSASAPASGSATASASASAAAAPSALTSLPLPTNRSIQFGYGNQQVALVFVGLTKPLFPAETFPITFTFANGGSVTTTLSVKLPVDSTLDAPTVNTEESAGGE